LTKLGIVTGMPREAALLRDVPALVRCDGPGPERARAAAEALIAAGAETLASFGVAGALDPRLKPGDLVVATAAIDEHGARYVAEPRAFGIRGAILTQARPVAGVADKRRLFAATGALAVDMETAAVAAAAHRAGRSFIAVRAICDAATVALPRAAVMAMREDGRVNALAILSRPQDWWGLLRLGCDYSRALSALRGVGGFL
jgi:adenosylhomocysteine nucleosidase